MRRRRALLVTLAAGALIAFVAGAVVASGGEDSSGSAARAAVPAAPPGLPRGGRRIFPEFRVVAYYGAPQNPELGALGIGTPDQAGRRLERTAARLRQAHPPGAARDGADRHHRPGRSGHGRHVPRAPDPGRDPALPRGGPAHEGAAAPRRPAGALGLRHRGARPGALAARTRREPGARSRMARRAPRGAGQDHRLDQRGDGERRRALAGGHRRAATTCPRSCWWSTSSRRT